MHSVYNEQFNCRKCLSRYAMRSDAEIVGKKSRQAKGCWGGYDKVIHQIDTIGFKSCIGNYTNPAMMGWIEAHSQYEKGVMPFPGALMDQPNKVIEIFQCIGNVKHEKIDSDRKALELNMKSGKHGR